MYVYRLGTSPCAGCLLGPSGLLPPPLLRAAIPAAAFKLSLLHLTPTGNMYYTAARRRRSCREQVSSFDSRGGRGRRRASPPPNGSQFARPDQLGKGKFGPKSELKPRRRRFPLTPSKLWDLKSSIVFPFPSILLQLELRAVNEVQGDF